MSLPLGLPPLHTAPFPITNPQPWRLLDHPVHAAGLLASQLEPTTKPVPALGPLKAGRLVPSGIYTTAVPGVECAALGPKETPQDLKRPLGT